MESDFWGVAILGLIALVATAVLVPGTLKKGKPASLKDQVKIITNGRLLLAFAITALGYGGTFVAFTFLGPILEQITGYPAGIVSLILLVYGLAIAIGNTIGGELPTKIRSGRSFGCL